MKFYQKIYDGAIKDLNTAIHLDPQHASLAHFNRALCYQALGNLQMVSNWKPITNGNLTVRVHAHLVLVSQSNLQGHK